MENTKNQINTIRLIFGAAQAEASRVEIAPEFVPQIAQARAELALMRSADVIDAVLACQRSGVSLARDVSLLVRNTSEKSQQPNKR